MSFEKSSACPNSIWDSAPGFLISWSGESAEPPLLTRLVKFTFTLGGSCLFLIHSDNAGISHFARGPIISSQIFGAIVPFRMWLSGWIPSWLSSLLILGIITWSLAFRQSVTWTTGIEAKNLMRSASKKWKKNGGWLPLIYRYALLIPLQRYLNCLADFFWIF